MKKNFLVLLILFLAGCSIPENAKTVDVSMPDVEPDNMPTVTIAISTRTPTPTIPSVIEQIATVTESDIFDIQDLPGRFYYWDSVPPRYTEFTPSLGDRGFRILMNDDPDVDNPNQAVSLAFSRYSSKIAYLVFNDKGNLELWLSDVGLQKFVSLWQDTEKWLGEYNPGSGTYPASIIWGPGDRSILITSRSLKEHLVFVSLGSGKIIPIEGKCNQLVAIKSSEQFSIGCTDKKEVNKLVVVDRNGETDYLNVDKYLVLDTVIEWAISDDEEQVIYVTEAYEIEMILRSKKKIKLPIYRDMKLVQSFDMDVDKVGLLWSVDNSKVLVFGYGTSEQSCPRLRSSVSGEYFLQPCWFLIDGQSGEILWSLTKSAASRLGFDWDQLSTSYEASFSPDGKWVAICVTEIGLDSFFVLSTTNYDGLILGNYTNNKIFWSEK